MNYIEQINGFWEKSEDDDLSGVDISVYFSLLNYANKLAWKDVFVCHWEIVCQTAKVSKNTYYKSMQKLHDLGYIDFQIGQKNVLKPKVSILKFKNNIENRKGTEVRTEREQHEEQKGNLNKHINLETNKPINNNKDASPTAPKFNFKNSLLDLGVNEQTASDFLEQRNKKRASNSETAFKLLKTEIEKSNLNPQQCIEIAILRGWQSLKSEWIKNHLATNGNGSVVVAPAKVPAHVHVDQNKNYSEGW